MFLKVAGYIYWSPWSFFKKPWFTQTFSVIREYQNFRKCMKELRFSKNWSRTSLHSRFSVLFLWTRKLLFSKRKHQIYEFKKKHLALNSNANLLLSRHFALITHDATLSMNSSIFIADLKGNFSLGGVKGSIISSDFRKITLVSSRKWPFTTFWTILLHCWGCSTKKLYFTICMLRLKMAHS